jgi:hypothetical protein
MQMMDCCDVAHILSMLLGFLVVGFCMYTASVTNAAIADSQYNFILLAHSLHGDSSAA